jgi:hypothetical protein
MPLSIQPDSDKPAILPEGQVGLGGEAELISITARKVPLKKDAPEQEVADAPYFVDFAVQVDTPDLGRLFVHSDPYGPNNTQMSRNAQGSMAKPFAAGVGLDAGQMTFADEADDKGNHALIGPNPCPCKVVVGVTVRKGKGENADRNGIKSLARLG